MDELTDSQRIFCNEYLKDMNGTRAYKIAYKSCKKESTANTNSSRLLSNAKIKNYLNSKMKELESKQIADATEVLKYLTRVIRCEETAMTVEGKIEPKISERTRAAELLGKRYALFTENIEHSGSMYINDPLKDLTTEELRKLIK